MITRRWRVNGHEVELHFSPLSRLLNVLRETLGLLSVKEGCGEGECGTCSVIINDTMELACMVAAAQLDDDVELWTAEGISKEHLGKTLEQSFDAAGAVQCGYCSPGMLVASYELLKRQPNPSSEDVRRALAGNLCRCTGYGSIIEAVQSAAGTKS